MSAAGGELARRAEVLERAIAAAGEVTRLEDALNRNLTTLAGARHFEQTALSLAAAVNMLSARLAETPHAAPIKLEPMRRRRRHEESAHCGAQAAANAVRNGWRHESIQRSQRRSQQQDGPGISLFPFLAVLICTMGALVPLLLAITRTARLQAEAAAVAKLAQLGTEVKTQREDVQWRIKQLKQSRAATESQLADARLELGHLEDHSRRLRDQLAQYERTGGDLERLENVDHQRLSQSQAELEQVRTQIQAAQQQLAQAHQAAAGRTPSYAVVPYEGPNQTRRRPIYLECRDDAVVLQPEGIALSESDFEGPLGPGNPLATALRAAREYMLAQRDFDPQAGEPYPMLLVRPEGINAYYAARAAMKSWGFDFGYELVGDDWKLAYPPPDPRLVELLRQVIASARASQARLIAAAPRHYDTGPKEVYRASSGGGFIREGGSGGRRCGRLPSRQSCRTSGSGEGRGTEGRGTGTERRASVPRFSRTPPGLAVPGKAAPARSVVAYGCGLAAAIAGSGSCGGGMAGGRHWWSGVDGDRNRRRLGADIRRWWRRSWRRRHWRSSVDRNRNRRRLRADIRRDRRRSVRHFHGKSGKWCRDGRRTDESVSIFRFLGHVPSP